MALTVANKNPNAGDERIGFRRTHFALVTFDSSYPTGGEAFDPVQFGVTDGPTHVIATPRKLDCAAGILTVQYDYTNKKLVVVCPNGAEVADTTDLSSFTADVVVIEGASS